jgi:hypothetical protein
VTTNGVALVRADASDFDVPLGALSETPHNFYRIVLRFSHSDPGE